MGRRKRETFAGQVARLRAAVEAAKNIPEFDAAREAIRGSLSPQQTDQTDLGAVCERKRKDLGYELTWERELGNNPYPEPF